MASKKSTILLWHGGNTFELFHELNRWKKVFAEKYSDLNTLTYSEADIANGTTVQQLTQSVQSTTLFGQRTTFIILKNILTAKKLTPEIAHAIENVLAKPSPDTFILFFQTEKIGNTELLKTIEKLETKGLATIKAFPLPSDSAALAAYIAGYAKRNTITIDLQTIRLLIEKTTDLAAYRAKVDDATIWLVMQELVKLHSYTGGKAITATAINELETTVHRDALWDLMNAILSGDAKKASLLFEERLSAVPATGQAAELRTLLTLLANQVKSMLAVKRLSGVALASFAKSARWSKGREFMIKKQAAALSEERLDALQQNILKLFSTSVDNPKLLKAEFSLLMVSA